MKYYIIAGEKSGDIHGSNLIKSLKNFDINGEFRGFGGNEMVSQGLILDQHYRQMAFMGFIEVLFNLFNIFKFIKIAKKSILDYQPDVVILIDYGGFNLKIASFLKKKNIKCFYYISPKIWAWNQNRAYKIKRLINKMFVILPFEKSFYSKFEWDVDYVGNPVLDSIKNHKFSTIKPKKSYQKIIAVLPGSRVQEIKNNLKVIIEVIKNNPNFYFIIVSVDNVNPILYNQLNKMGNIEIINNKSYDVLKISSAAIVTSGTATLETALLKIPQIVVYKTSFISYWLSRLLIQVKYISLVNLIMNKKIVEELIQYDFNKINLNKYLKKIINDESVIKTIKKDYDKLERKLDIGTSASFNTASKIFHELNKTSS